jgi:hypothetical protein
MKDVFELNSFINDLISENKNIELARSIVDAYEDKITTVQEHEVISEICKFIGHNRLRLKCLQYAYTNCINSEKLSQYRFELAKTFLLMNEPEQSLFYNNIDYKNDNSNFYTLIERVKILNALGRTEESDSLLELLLPENKEEKEDLSLVIGKKQLRSGELDIGVKSVLFPEKGKYAGLIPYNFWHGTKNPGKTIIIHGRGDIGDQFAYFRFFKQFKDLEMNSMFYAAYNKERKDLTEIYRRHGIEAVETTQLFDLDFLWVNLSSLPSYFQLEEETLWEGPYITPIKNSKNKLEDTKLKIGIKLMSDSKKNNYRKEIPVGAFFDSLPEASLYNFDSRQYPNCNNLRKKITSWDDTLDYIDQMDVIISCDTSLVHAAGAMGKNTILLCPLDSHYMWISNRTDNTTPWYGSNFKILKQVNLREWKEPLLQIKPTIEELLK